MAGTPLPCTGRTCSHRIRCSGQTQDTRRFDRRLPRSPHRPRARVAKFRRNTSRHHRPRGELSGRGTRTWPMHTGNRWRMPLRRLSGRMQDQRPRPALQGQGARCCSCAAACIGPGSTLTLARGNHCSPGMRFLGSIPWGTSHRRQHTFRRPRARRPHNVGCCMLRSRGCRTLSRTARKTGRRCRMPSEPRSDLRSRHLSHHHPDRAAHCCSETATGIYRSLRSTYRRRMRRRIWPSARAGTAHTPIRRTDPRTTRCTGWQSSAAPRHSRWRPGTWFQQGMGRKGRRMFRFPAGIPDCGQCWHPSRGPPQHSTRHPRRWSGCGSCLGSGTRTDPKRTGHPGKQSRLCTALPEGTADTRMKGDRSPRPVRIHRAVRCRTSEPGTRR